MKQLQPLDGSKLRWLTAGLSLIVFMQILDGTIANVALPTIAGNLGAAISQGTWVITSFGVALAISIPLTSWLSKRIGENRLFVISGSLFVISSWCCGMANSLGMLIFFRIIQGAVAGPMLPLSQSILINNCPISKRAMAIGIWSMVVVVAPIFGPILGGYISNNWHWGWIFFINIPIGIFAIFISWYNLRGRESEITPVPIDKVGLALLVIGVGALQLMLDRGNELDWFNSGEIISLAVVAFICICFLIVWVLDTNHPIIDLSIFKDRNFAVGTLCSCLSFMIYIGTVILLPLLLQTQFGYTAVWSGLAAAPIGIFPVLLAPIIGKFSHKMDMRVLVSISFIIFAISLFWRSNFNLQMTFWDAFWPQLFQGIGVGLFFMPLMTITFSNIEPKKMAAATSMANFLRQVFFGIGVSIFVTLWKRREVVHNLHLTEHISHLDTTSQYWMQQLTNLGIVGVQAQAAYISRLISQQAHIISSNEIFYASGIIFLLLISVIWFVKSTKK